MGSGYQHIRLTVGHAITSRHQSGGRLLAGLHCLGGKAGVVLKFGSEGSEISHTFLGRERQESTKQMLIE